jgi:hypothetical protein
MEAVVEARSGEPPEFAYRRIGAATVGESAASQPLEPVH